MGINIKILANELGLSIATVSRALQDSHLVAPNTRKMVQERASQLNYYPNLYASSLRRRQSKTIAVIIPEISNHFFSLAVKGIQQVVEKEGYSSLMYVTGESLKKEIEIIRYLRSGRVDGVIIALSRETGTIEHLKSLKNENVPLVFLDRISDEMEAPKVFTNNYQSAFNATEHLIENGCERIAYLQFSNKLVLAHRRFLGYKNALIAHHLQLNQELVLNCSTNSEENYQLIRRLIVEKGVDGIFGSVESVTITSYDVCRELALSISKDVKIVSFSNLATAHLLSPPLTTISQPAFEMGLEAASLLFRNLNKYNNYPVNEKMIFEAKLIKRESSGEKMI